MSACKEFDAAKREIRTPDDAWITLLHCIRLQTVADARRVLRRKKICSERWKRWDAKPDYYIDEGLAAFNMTWNHIERGGR